MADDPGVISPGVSEWSNPDGQRRRPFDVIAVLWSIAEGGNQPYPPTEAELAETREWIKARKWDHKVPPGLF
jgi:hypothetical protein